ncbi:Rpn family recombination-promoting nuclease/putative transposase [Anabaena lutea]|uniref:Rpn family recombination-promoting nuclease/putative transposase n=1 Tax=Anabaena lutea FACHB-196 TaxID=2692881 RepID=A0ABR8FMK5_9NOST|nr:Rpn family recombination-promoting nuclease/putative transposase [Anabaena lutea]MBD2571408.1 Rpn family recombination-promoting nuclease/putative transposase [Anabaena lutea FACHB-196]
MSKPADVSTKRLISLAPDNWVKWVTQIPDVVAGEILNSEFQWISRESDVLIRVESKEYGKFLVLNELQLRYKPEMPRRMRAYSGLAEEKYKLPTYPVLINILKTGDAEIPTRYESNLAGLEVRQDYRVINLWEVDVRIALEQPLPSLLPFVPILKGGEDESIIREALRLLQADEQLNQLETVLAFFATFVLDSSLVQEIMRWDMTVLRESPWYEEILQRGKREERLSNIESYLKVKCGDEGLKFMPKISEISDFELLGKIYLSIIAVESLEELKLVMDNLS